MLHLEFYPVPSCIGSLLDPWIKWFDSKDQPLFVLRLVSPNLWARHRRQKNVKHLNTTFKNSKHNHSRSSCEFTLDLLLSLVVIRESMWDLFKARITRHSYSSWLWYVYSTVIYTFKILNSLQVVYCIHQQNKCFASHLLFSPGMTWVTGCRTLVGDMWCVYGELCDITRPRACFVKTGSVRDQQLSFGVFCVWFCCGFWV